MSDAPNLRPDAFAGTAEAYARFRPAYPQALLDALVAAAAPATPSALLDLACGSGRIALDLAPTFDRVCAVDLEPEMVAVGAQEATRRGIGNVAWSVAAAEAFEALASAFDLITIGEAFHLLDQRLIAQKAHVWLKPGGCLATRGAAGFRAGAGPWQAHAAEIARRWMARAFPKGWATARPGAESAPEGIERVLTRAGFVDVASRVFTAHQAWTIDAIVGYFDSTSVCSRAALGEHFAGFETDIRTSLEAMAESQLFHEELHFGVTLARRPAD
jgi:SAM-dependent methyltransferase